MKAWRGLLVGVALAGVLQGCRKDNRAANKVYPAAARQQVASLVGEVDAARALMQPVLDDVDDVSNAFAASPYPVPGSVAAAQAAAAELKGDLTRLGDAAVSLKQRLDAVDGRVPQSQVTAVQNEVDAALVEVRALDTKAQVVRGHVASAREVLDSHRVNNTQDTADEIRSKLESDRLARDVEQKRIMKEREAAERKEAEAARQQEDRQRAARPHHAGPD